MTRRLLRVGLTGGLASGKSTVRELFTAAGVATVDSDALARAALAPGSPLVATVEATLGEKLRTADGILDRARLAALVFADPDKRRALEAIVHPEVVRGTEAALRDFAEHGHAIGVVDSPLLIEAGRVDDFDRIVVVHCSLADQIERAMARSMSESDARARIGAQLPLDEKAARADYVVDSSGTIEQTRIRARAVLAALRRDATVLTNGRPLPQPTVDS